MTRRWLVCCLLPAVAAFLPAQPAAGETPSAYAASRGQQLRVRNYAGSVEVVATADDHVRVTADVAAEELLVELRGRIWSVVPAQWERDAEAFELDLPHRAVVRIVERAPSPVALRVEAPAWMPVVVETPRAEVTISGVEAPVEVTTMTGDIEVRGGASRVRLMSMIGRIEVAGARGLVVVEGTTQPVTLRDCEGNVRVETTQGDVSLENLAATDVEVTSLGGDVTLRSAIAPLGRYRLSTHSGDLRLELIRPIDATFEVRAFQGEFRSELAASESVEAGRGNFVLGDGGAKLRLESFSGRIEVLAVDREPRR